MAFHKVVIQFEILCSDDMEHKILKNASLKDIYTMVMDGSCSGRFLEPSEDKILSGLETAKALMEQGSDPEFFQLDLEGNPLKD